MADATIKNIPQNRALGTLAEWLMSAKNKTGTIGEFLLGQAPETLANMSYGFYPTQGTGQTFGLKPESLDVAGLIPTGLLGGLAAKTYANLAGKELARNIAQQTTFGQMIDPRMNMIAYHGSPHSFDEFRMSKIGTGEGAQAYGHGLYFADSPNIAKFYQNSLIPPKDVEKRIINDLANEELLKNKGDKAQAISGLTELLNESWSDKKRIKQMIKVLETGKPLKFNQGAFYKVDIADEAIPNMLLWDKPLSEQPKAIQDELKRIGGSASNGAEAYKELMFQARMEGIKSDKASLRNNVEQLAASKRLKELGIPGIRYLDAGSRGQGAGTMNTVVFDDKLVKILEKNGKPIKARSTK